MDRRYRGLHQIHPNPPASHSGCQSRSVFLYVSCYICAHIMIILICAMKRCKNTDTKINLWFLRVDLGPEWIWQKKGLVNLFKFWFFLGQFGALKSENFVLCKDCLFNLDWNGYVKMLRGVVVIFWNLHFGKAKTGIFFGWTKTGIWLSKGLNFSEWNVVDWLNVELGFVFYWRQTKNWVFVFCNED